MFYCFSILPILIFQETLKKAEEIFGMDNKDLYLSFQGMLNRGVRWKYRKSWLCISQSYGSLNI